MQPHDYQFPENPRNDHVESHEPVDLMEYQHWTEIQAAKENTKGAASPTQGGEISPSF